MNLLSGHLGGDEWIRSLHSFHWPAPSFRTRHSNGNAPEPFPLSVLGRVSRLIWEITLECEAIEISMENFTAPDFLNGPTPHS